MTLTRTNVKSLAKNLLDEKGSLFWTDSLLNTLSDEANRDVWREIIRVSPEHFLNVDSFTWPASTERIDMEDASIFTKVPYKIIGVEDYSSAGGITASNLPRKWMPFRFSERQKLHLGADALYGANPHYYATQGQYMYMAPLTGAALNVTAYTIAHLDVMAADGTAVLGGRADMFHDAVYKRLAYLMNIKQNGNNPMIEKLWDEAIVHIEMNAESRQVDEPWSVKVLGHY